MGLVLTWPVGHARSKPDTAIPAGRPVLAYVVGSLLGGAATGLVLGALGTVVRDSLGTAAPSIAAAIAIATAAIALEWRGTVAPLPERRQQVPRQWLLWRRREATALVFGLIIGAGAFTYLKHASAYVVAVLCTIAPSPAAAVAIGALYGLLRAASVIVMWRADRAAARRPYLPGGQTTPAIHRILAVVAALAFISAVSLTAA